MKYDKLIHNIDELSSKKGVNKTTALTQSGVGKNFIYNINKGSAPSSEKIQQLADYFSVSTDYLLGNTDNPHSVHLSNQQDLTPDEEKLLTDYRSLNDLGKQEAQKRLNELTQINQYRPTDSSDDDGKYETIIAAARGGDGKPIIMKKKKGRSIDDLPDYHGGRR